MPSKKLITFLGVCLILSSSGLWAGYSQAADTDDEVKVKKHFTPVITDFAFSNTEPPKARLSRDELLKQAILRMKDSKATEPTKPVRFFVDEDEKPLAGDLKSFFLNTTEEMNKFKKLLKIPNLLWVAFTHGSSPMPLEF